MTAHFDAVVFDCDGVLVDSELLSARVTQRMVADLEWHAEVDELMTMFTGSSREFFEAEIERRIGRPLEPGWDAPYRGWLEQALRSELTVIPGIVEALQQIDLPVAVASNSSTDRIRISLEVAGLLDRFDGRISSAVDVAAGKPAPDVYLRAAEVLGVPPERCIAIDDSRFGVEAARRAGMFVLAYDREGASGLSVVTGDRLRIIEDLAELPGAVDRLVATGQV